MLEELLSAAKECRPVEFEYDGLKRVVEIHVIGRSRTGDLILFGWQVAGNSSSGNLGWRYFRLSKIEQCSSIGGRSGAPRPDFLGAPAIVEIIYEIY
ncbi:WYL domain-containing protein [Notoacmeibacter ruber]|uniref:WYL domain-containing protein n=1 Tax=Notoacmeibacter ruber TaxID=2670375 RepID=A0A3L7JF86_9HYPH|nr:WYL domain-containing protein [Notoacmeibacter ruber]RLQ88995.1 hypothetical protein D8780_12860 [Notoacmeibacter ruber]